MRYWLLKSEPSTFSIVDLEQSKEKTTSWEGVRNYQARNFLRDEIKKGDLAFFYHSSCKEPGIVGIVKIIREGYPDKAALNPSSPYYDPRSSDINPIWYCVDVRLKTIFKHPMTLTALRKIHSLKNMQLLKKGNRLSVLPVTKQEWNVIFN